MNEEKHKHHRERRKKKSVHTIIRNAIFVIAAAVFFYSSYQLYIIYSEYSKGEKEYESIMETVIIESSQVSQEEGEQAQKFVVDFEALQAINSEAVAWLRFEEPSVISYPVVQGKDNAKYLHTTFEGKKNSAGALFVDANNAGDFSDRNTFIYGHNMKNGSMFGQLRKYKTATFCEEHPYFYIYSADGKEVQYQVFAVCIVEDTSESYKKAYIDDADYLQYINYIRDISRYDVDVELTAESQIVSLSTCTNVSETQRLLVHGVKISEKVVGE